MNYEEWFSENEEALIDLFCVFIRTKKVFDVTFAMFSERLFQESIEGVVPVREVYKKFTRLLDSEKNISNYDPNSLEIYCTECQKKCSRVSGKGTDDDVYQCPECKAKMKVSEIEFAETKFAFTPLEMCNCCEQTFPEDELEGFTLQSGVAKLCPSCSVILTKLGGSHNCSLDDIIKNHQSSI